ncbi:MAG: anti-sigma factor antagonist [Actinoplanes sp.]|nr:anti-sigma factor antagonist [Actinoplanes sp.]
MTSEQVTFAKIGGTDLVRLAGEIDLANAPAIGREIVTHMTDAGAVLIDLTSVSFLDSAGVRLLDALVGDLDDQGTPIRLVVGESGAARMTLQLCAFRDDLMATDLARAAADLGPGTA